MSTKINRRPEVIASDPWLSVQEIAEYTGRHEQTIRKAYRRREFAVSRPKTAGGRGVGHVRARKSEIDRWMGADLVPARRLA